MYLADSERAMTKVKAFCMWIRDELNGLVPRALRVLAGKCE
jgi:hypothetical protein